MGLPRGLLTALAILFLCGAQGAGVADGEARLARGDARGAMIRFEEAVRADPSDAHARLGLARALLVLGEAERAEKMARAARREPALRAEGALVHAEALHALGRFEEAARVAAEAPPSLRRAGLLSLARAEEALVRGAPEEALRLLPDAVRDDGLRVRAQLVAARAQYARGDLVRARRLAERVLRVEATSFDALLLQARLALRAGDTGRAGALAGRMLRMDPGNVSAGAVAVEVALRRGEVDEARRLHAALAPAEGTDPRPAYLAALIALAEGDVRSAGDAVATIEPWLESIEGGAVLLAQIKMRNGHLAQAERSLRARLRTNPRDADARSLLIDVYDRSGKNDRADTLLAEGLTLTPDASSLVARQVERLIAAGRADEATTMLSSRNDAAAALTAALAGTSSGVAAKASTGAPGADALIEAYAALRRGDGQAAVAAARTAVERTGGGVVALNLLAAAQASSGDEDGARRTLDTVIRREPDYLAAIANKAALEGGQGALLEGLRQAREAGAKSSAVFEALAAEAWTVGAADEALAAAAAAGDAPPSLLLRARLEFLTGAPLDETLTRLLAVTDDARVLLPAAALLEAGGDAGRAAPALERAARRTSDPRVALAAVTALEAAGDSDRAAARLRAARDGAPTDPRLGEAEIVRAASGGNAGGDVVADVVRDGALSAPHARAVLLQAQGETAAAADVLLKADADRDALMMALALVPKVDASRADRILAAATGLSAARPADAGLLLALGGARLSRGDATGAEAAWQDALAARPGDPILLNNLADLRGRGDASRGLPLARDAYAAAPTVPAVAQTYADLLARSGDQAAAVRILRRARLTAPTDRQLKAALARVER